MIVYETPFDAPSQWLSTTGFEENTPHPTMSCLLCNFDMFVINGVTVRP